MTAETEAAKKVRNAMNRYEASAGHPVPQSRRVRAAMELFEAADKAQARSESLAASAAHFGDSEYADELRINAERERLTADRHRARAAELLT